MNFRAMAHPLPLKFFSFLIALLLIVPVGAHAQTSACPPNMDFEDGNLSNWLFYTGTCCPTSTGNFSGPVAGRHELMTGPGLDPYGGFPVVSPNGGNFSLKLGNNVNGAQAERARYYVRVPTNPNNIYTLLYSYAVVFQDPAHAAADQPRFEVTVFDSATGVPIPCNQFNFVASASLPGFQSNGIVRYKPWATSSIDLSQMLGKTVAVDFTTGDCALGGHFGYAYLDVTCNFFQSHTLYCPDVSTYTLNAPPGFSGYEWRNGTLTTIIGTGQSVTVPTPKGTDSFAVILTPYDGFGCPDTIFTKFYITQMTVDVTLDTALCKGETIRLNSGTNSTSGPYTYSWTPSTGLSCSNCDSPYAAPTSNTKYYITITDKDGCKAVDSVFVRVDEPVVADIEVGDTFCSHTVINIINKPNNPHGTDYRWDVNKDKGNLLTGVGSSSIKASWYVYGIKSILLDLVNGTCSDSDSVSIYIKSAPQAEFDITRDVCVGSPATLNPTKNDSATYIWTIDGQTITDTTYASQYKLTWNTTGKMNVKLLTRNANGCYTIKERQVGVHEYPQAAISLASKTTICKGRHFELQTPEGYRYEYGWRPPQYFDDNGFHKTGMTAERTEYVYVDVTNEWECTTTDSFYVRADECCDIFVPDAFTPNNDGINDIFWSQDLGKHGLVMFKIANRRGEIVYDSKSAKGWDGSYNGEMLGQDTLNYYIKYICEGQGEMEKKGTVILIR